MIVNWGQLIATVATICSAAACVSAIWLPFGRRREQRKLDALSAAATLATVQLRDTVTEVVTAAVDEVKADVLATVTTSHEGTAAAITELKSEVAVIAQESRATTLKLATEFGGNGNGIRQSINSITNDLAQLTGKFTQHVVEGKG